MRDLTKIREHVNDKKVTANLLRQNYQNERRLMKEEQDNQDSLIEASEVARAIAKEVQETAHKQIASLVTRCLKAVFDDPYEFKILFEEKRGKTEAKLVFERNGMQVDPLEASGGGVVDVAAFSLRLSCVLRSKNPKLRKILILDEPFKNVSKDYHQRIVNLLETLSKEKNVQIIMITHIESLKLGNIVEL